MGPVYVAPPAVIQCSVDVERRPRNVIFRGKIISTSDANGTYQLEIVKTSRSGSSNVVQSGKFKASANKPLLVGMADLDAGPETRIVAYFTVRATGTDSGCRSEKEISDE
jgi:hypothetical protein